MTWLVLVAVVAAAALVLICCLALVEVFRQLSDVRTALNLEDSPSPLGLKSGELRVEEVGLPDELALEPRAIVVFLSERCVTCLTIAEGLRGESPARVWFVLPSSPSPTMLLEPLSHCADRIILDEDDAIMLRIGLNTTPMVLSISYGEIKRAHAVSSVRQLRALIPGVIPRQPEPVRVQDVVVAEGR